MTAGLINLPNLSPQQVNPFSGLVSNALDAYQNAIRAKYLNAQQQAALQKVQQENQIQAPYAQNANDFAQAALQKAQLEPNFLRAQAFATNQQGNLASSEAQKNLFLMNHPEYINMAAAYYDRMINGGNNQTQTNPNITTTNSGPLNTPTQSPSQSSPQPMTGSYGIPLPNVPSSAYDPLFSKIFGITPMTSAAIDNYKAQTMDQYNQYNKEMANATNESQAATHMNQVLSIYNNAMDNTDLKGQYLGKSPALTSSAQLVDKFSNQMIPDAAAELRQAMGNARFSNLDMNVARNLKPDRTLSDENRKFITNWMTAVNQRTQEKPQFYSVMGNPQNGAQKQYADELWSQYQSDYPLANSKGNKVLSDNLGHWQEYVTPNAIQQVMKKGHFDNSQSSSNKITKSWRRVNGKLILEQ